MYIKSYNIWKENNIKNGNTLQCKTNDGLGYLVGCNDKYDLDLPTHSVEPGPEEIYTSLLKNITIGFVSPGTVR